MPISNSGLYRLTTNFDIAGNKTCNVYHYRNVAGTEDKSVELATLFDTFVIANIQTVLHQDVSFSNIEVVNLTGTLAPHVYNYGVAKTGLLVGQRLPDFLSAQFKYNRFYNDTRSGSKRIGPASENEMVDNFWTPGYVALLQILEANLSAALVGAVETFVPIILGKLIDLATGWIINNISSVTCTDKVATQGSRKV